MIAFEPKFNKMLIEDNNFLVKKDNSRLLKSKIMTILVMYFCSGSRTFKDFYTKVIWKHWNDKFSNLVKYTKFVELIPTVFIPVLAFFKLKRLKKSEVIFFIDSIKISVCKNKRINRNKFFKVGKSRMNDQLKNICDIEHFRHKNSINFFVNLISGLIKWTYFIKKPPIKINILEKEEILLKSSSILGFSL